MKTIKITLAAFLAATSLLAAGPALAHAKLVASNPAANATLRSGPQSITLTFNERIVPAFSKFTIVMPAHDGMEVPVETMVTSDRKRIVGTLPRPLARGLYNVNWTAAGSDGHKMTGRLAFTVS